MRIRPRVPWHTRNFYTGGATARITLDLAVVRLQRWMRKKCKEVWSTREIEFWNGRKQKRQRRAGTSEQGGGAQPNPRLEASAN